MNKTVVAIFNSMKEAQIAADDLFDNGFLKENIDVSSGEKYEEDEKGESAITRFFKNLFGTNDEKTKQYSHVAKKRYVVAVHAQSVEEALEACEILDDKGAIDVNDHYNKYFTPVTENRDAAQDEKTDEEDIQNNVEAHTDDEIADESQSKIVPAIGENPEVPKKEVPTGGVRVRSRIVEKPVEENLRLREEHVHIERRKVDRAPTDEELRNFKKETAEFTADTKVPGMDTTPKVVEEVSVQKDVDLSNENVHDKVRSSDVVVEDLDDDMDKP